MQLLLEGLTEFFDNPLGFPNDDLNFLLNSQGNILAVRCGNIDTSTGLLAERAVVLPGLGE